MPSLNAVNEPLVCVCLRQARTDGREDESEVARAVEKNDCSVVEERFGAMPSQSTMSTVPVTGGILTYIRLLQSCRAVVIDFTVVGFSKNMGREEIECKTNDKFTGWWCDLNKMKLQSTFVRWQPERLRKKKDPWPAATEEGKELEVLCDFYYVAVVIVSMGLETYVVDQSGRIARSELETECSSRLFCSTKHGDDKKNLRVSMDSLSTTTSDSSECQYSAN